MSQQINQKRDLEALSWAIRQSLTELHQDSPSSTACALFDLFKDRAPRSLRGVIDTHGHQIFRTFTPEREAIADHLKSFCDDMASQLANEIARQSATAGHRATIWTFGRGYTPQSFKNALRGLKSAFSAGQS